eukprot:TRINITY_DN80517_c0_g1_i1.p1 TRINITY_DN80517_c0_g1~~TRINITY_DN80517_c0_g1_i1.p1  ORF type:complete len:211 (+),score=54.35 TRINITY_DN80517_c0_g1_i1:89-721(+)
MRVTPWLALLVLLAFTSAEDAEDAGLGLQLHRAARDGDVHKVAALLVSLKDTPRNLGIDFVGEDGATPLCAAISGGAVTQGEVEQVVGQLIAAGADVNFRDNWGSTPLYYAAKYGPAAVVKDILQAGAANVDPHDKKGSTALLEAIRRGDVESIQLLVAKGASINRPDLTGETPKKAAMAHEDTRVLDAVMGSGGEPASKPKVTLQNDEL